MGNLTDYSPEVKAAVMAALLAGQSVGSCAKEYKIPRGTVASWSSKLDKKHSISNTKKEEVGELLIQYLRANLTALKAQAEQFADKDWLRQQSAENAAVLHGVLTDKAIRLLEAFNDPGQDTAN